MIEADKNKECCGTCKHHNPAWNIKEKVSDWICMNELSENYTYFTEYEDCCEDWEEK